MDSQGSVNEAAGGYRPLSLMLVEYKKGDTLGFCFAWISMIPIFYIIALFTTILLRRDLTTIFYSFGILLTEASNALLKRYFKQPRPFKDSVYKSGHFSRYGMPSDHSQMMFYASTFFILLVIYRCYYQTSSKFYNYLYKTGLIAVAAVTAVLVAYSRVYLEYHTVEQVVVGALIGAFSGALWFFLVNNVFSKYFYTMCGWSIAEFLMIRDYSHVPHIMLFQYTVERNEAILRRKSKLK